MDRTLVEALQQGAQVVTATKRLARTLRDGYDAALETSGLQTWRSPRILPLDAWVRNAWESTWSDRGPVSEDLLQALWEEAIRNDPEPGVEGAAAVEATALQARQARRLVELYRMVLDPGPYDSPEVVALCRWSVDVDERLSERRWLDPASVPRRLAAVLRAGEATVPPSLIVAGFDELPPGLAEVLKAAEERGAHVRYLPFPARNQRVTRFEAEDEEAEARAAACWVRERLEEAEVGSVGIVALGLESCAARLERMLAEELVPASVRPGTAAGVPVYDISWGAALADESLVQTAFDMLSVGAGRADWEQWRQLLLSPHWGPPGERLARAVVAADLAAAGEVEPNVDRVVRSAQARGLTGTAHCLEALAVEVGAGVRFPSAWAEQFLQTLQACAWGDGKPLDSREFQVREHFWDALVRLRGFDALDREVDGAWAVRRLRTLCRGPFRPEVRGARCSVLGPLEAAGCEFDHLWVMGLHAGALPQPARPNPFLPYVLQVEHGVRQASPETQLERDRGLLDRLVAAGTEVVLSNPLRVRGEEVPPSPLLSAIDAAPSSFVPREHSWLGTQRLQPLGLEWVEDRAPGVEEGFHLRRAAAFFADQAACPFRAFARHRLGASDAEEPELTPAAMERGEAVHRMLEAFWTAVPDTDTLDALDGETRERREEAAVAAGLETLARRRAQFSPGQHGLERARLLRLLREMVAVERRRGAFRVTEAESLHDAHLGGLDFRVRIDRVDETADGRTLLIDYKTGRTDVRRWFEERPREPQLPLYSLVRREARGVAFAVARPGECAVRLVKEGENGLEGARSLPPGLTRWEELLAHWEERLALLADEIRSGHALVNPQEATDCRYCELVALCRYVPEESGEGDGADPKGGCAE